MPTREKIFHNPRSLSWAIFQELQDTIKVELPYDIILWIIGISSYICVFIDVLD